MATTGTFDFDPNNASLIEEAYFRIGVLPQSLTGEHIEQALFSLNLLLIEWENDFPKQYQITQTTLAAYVNGDSFVLPNSLLRIITVVYRKDGVDIPVHAVGRDDYNMLYDKNQSGDRPDRYFLDKSRDAPTMYVWPTTNNTTDSLIVTYLRQSEDAGNLSNTPDVHRRWLNAIASGLAHFLSEKYNPGLYERMEARAIKAFKNAKSAERENSSVRFKVNLNTRRRRYG